jgi:hypothetical protein
MDPSEKETLENGFITLMFMEMNKNGETMLKNTIRFIKNN